MQARVDRLAAAWRQTAAERDLAGGHAAREREQLRESGLLGLTIARAHGGWGAPWSVFYDALRRLAGADSALAHLFAFHHLQLATVLLYGSAEQQQRLLGRSIERGLFWGNALNPNDRRAVAQVDRDGAVVHGSKSFCSGSVGSDMLTVSAWHEPTQTFLTGVVPSRARGVTIEEDWDAFGQRQTDSGTVHFDEVRVPSADILVAPGVRPGVRATLRAQFAQLILVHLYLGIAEGALSEALHFVPDSRREADDPYLLQRLAELHLQLRPARVLAEQAAARLEAAYGRGEALTPRERGEVAVAVIEAKVLAHRAALAVCSQLFEVTGARSTSRRHALDRFWRNARVHTLHDPIDLKLRDLGRHVLDGRYPEPTPYS
ncbi:acyl-CoA dehydrogenase family protein (plasmid) [Eleftheria terrae]|nr:acyl-CoA dehydrogenase family protein [Eleftheria terrae]